MEIQKVENRERLRQNISSNIIPKETAKKEPIATFLPIYERSKLSNEKEIIKGLNYQNGKKHHENEKNIFNNSIDLLLANNEKEEEKMNRKQKEGNLEIHKEWLQVNENIVKKKEKFLKEKCQERIQMEKSIEMFNKMKAEMEERRKNNSQRLNIDLTKQIIEKKVKDKIEKESIYTFGPSKNKSKILSKKMNSSITSQDNPMVGLISPSSEQIIHESVCKQCKKNVKNNI